MPRSSDKKPKLVEWTGSATAILRATRRPRLVTLANKVDAWAVKASRRRVVVFMVALLAFVVVAKPMYSSVRDAVILLADSWGGCYERDPSSTEFKGRKSERQCAPGQVTLFTWREEGDTAACTVCNNRALQPTAVKGDGQQTWTEYYLVQEGSPAALQWRSAHNWSLSHLRLNRGDGSYDEGLVLQREDHGAPVCSLSGKPLTLELFVSLDAGLGCDASFAVATPFAGFRKLLDSARGFSCDAAKNSLHYRWVQISSGEVKGPCPADRSNPYLTKPDPVPPIKWNKGPLVSVLRRD